MNDPITPEYRELMNRTAAALSKAFPGAGFTLLLWRPAEPNRANYISNADRTDMIAALRETADRLERGRPQ